MVGKRIQFDEQTWQAIEDLLSRHGLTFQDSLTKHSRTCSRNTEPYTGKGGSKRL
jgi:hypothetical protein